MASKVEDHAGVIGTEIRRTILRAHKPTGWTLHPGQHLRGRIAAVVSHGVV